MNVRSESRAEEDWWPCGKRFRMSVTEGTEEHDMNFNIVRLTEFLGRSFSLLSFIIAVILLWMPSMTRAIETFK